MLRSKSNSFYQNKPKIKLFCNEPPDPNRLRRTGAESRPYLNHQDKIELERILFSLYSKYKSGFFFCKKQKFSKTSKEELKALKTLSANKNLIISKSDKGNGVGIMDKNWITFPR